jgi:hypothetical protein
MSYDIRRTDEEIDDLLNACADAEDRGRSKFPGMTFEQGIEQGIKWLTDPSKTPDYPLE